MERRRGGTQDRRNEARTVQREREDHAARARGRGRDPPLPRPLGVDERAPAAARDLLHCARDDVATAGAGILCRRLFRDRPDGRGDRAARPPRCEVAPGRLVHHSGDRADGWQALPCSSGRSARPTRSSRRAPSPSSTRTWFSSTSTCRTAAVSPSSPRSREVLQLIARGYRYKEIAARLHLSVKTIEAHVSSVLRKLQLSSRTS
jgi:DNA-binding CsgD family transcriptional regulator